MTTLRISYSCCESCSETRQGRGDQDIATLRIGVIVVHLERERDKTIFRISCIFLMLCPQGGIRHNRALATLIRVSEGG